MGSGGPGRWWFWDVWGQVSGMCESRTQVDDSWLWALFPTALLRFCAGTACPPMRVDVQPVCVHSQVCHHCGLHDICMTPEGDPKTPHTVRLLPAPGHHQSSLFLWMYLLCAFHRGPPGVACRSASSSSGGTGSPGSLLCQMPSVLQTNVLCFLLATLLKLGSRAVEPTCNLG